MSYDGNDGRLARHTGHEKSTACTPYLDSVVGFPKSAGGRFSASEQSRHPAAGERRGRAYLLSELLRPAGGCEDRFVPLIDHQHPIRPHHETIRRMALLNVANNFGVKRGPIIRARDSQAPDQHVDSTEHRWQRSFHAAVRAARVPLTHSARGPNR